MPRPKPKKPNHHRPTPDPAYLARRAEREKAIHEKIVTDQVQAEIADRALTLAEEEYAELADRIDAATEYALARRDAQPKDSMQWHYYEGVSDALWSMAQFLDTAPEDGKRVLHPESLLGKRDETQAIDVTGEEVAPARRTA